MSDCEVEVDHDACIARRTISTEQIRSRTAHYSLCSKEKSNARIWLGRNDYCDCVSCMARSESVKNYSLICRQRPFERALPRDPTLGRFGRSQRTTANDNRARGRITASAHTLWTAVIKMFTANRDALSWPGSDQQPRLLGTLPRPPTPRTFPETNQQLA